MVTLVLVLLALGTFRKSQTSARSTTDRSLPSLEISKCSVFLAVPRDITQEREKRDREKRMYLAYMPKLHPSLRGVRAELKQEPRGRDHRGQMLAGLFTHGFTLS